MAFAYSWVQGDVRLLRQVGARRSGDVCPTSTPYLDLVLGMFLGFGLAFETPIATMMLVWSGLVPISRR